MKKLDDIICVHKVYDSMEAELMKSQLEAENIDCFLKSDNAGGVLSHLTYATGIEIMVKQTDVQQAKTVLKI